LSFFVKVAIEGGDLSNVLGPSHLVRLPATKLPHVRLSLVRPDSDTGEATEPAGRQRHEDAAT
jgi:hypothetical protein